MRFALWGRKRRDRELQEEMQTHLTLAEREEMESGRNRKEAGFAARREFGNVSIAEETTRDMWGWRWLVDFFQDTRYAIRALVQRPGFATVALLTLALGTGATTVMFTVVNGVLLKPLPYPEPEGLVTLQEETEKATEYGNIWAFAYPNYLDCKRESRSLDMAAWRYSVGTLSAKGEAQYVSARQIAPDLFSTLSIPLARGRAFLPEEDRPGAAPAIDRQKGFKEIIAKYPDMKIIKSQTGDFNRAKGKETMEALGKFL